MSGATAYALRQSGGKMHCQWARALSDSKPAVLCLALAICVSSRIGAEELATAVVELEQRIPAGFPAFCSIDREEVSAKCCLIDRIASDVSAFDDGTTHRECFDRLAALMQAARRIDQRIDETLQLKRRVVDQPAGESRRDSIKNYVWVVSKLIDVSGRLRETERLAIEGVAKRFSKESSARDQLFQLLLENSSSTGASVVADWLFRPPSVSNAERDQVRHQVLALISATREVALVRDVARFLRHGGPDANSTLAAVETICTLGVPQDLFDASPSTDYGPPTSASELRAYLDHLDHRQFSPSQRVRHAKLIARLDARIARGVTSPRFQIGRYEVAPGDWVLMHNGSPYNLFTDISPGLFTHAGIVTAHVADDGRPRMVIVDVPQRSATVRATNIEAALGRARYFVALRHENHEAAKRMAEVAAQIIGNPVAFDLCFTTKHVEAIVGSSLDGVCLKTHCAGLLALAALESGAQRSEFFPIPERPGDGLTLQNGERVGMIPDDDLLTPTGAMFAPTMHIVNRSHPVFVPHQYVESTVYERFSNLVRTHVINPEQSWNQSLRESFAVAAGYSPWLKSVAAGRAGVNPQTDLASASRVLAIAEILNEIAQCASSEFLLAEESLLRPTAELGDPQRGATGSDATDRCVQMRNRHARLWSGLRDGTVSAWEVRQYLVGYYVARGERECLQRLFDVTSRP